MSGSDELLDEVRLLRQEVGTTGRAVSKVTNRQDEMIQRLRRMVACLTVLFLGCLALTAVVWSNYVRINEVQTRTSSEVLCPLYAIFLRSYHPELQKPDRLAEYEANFAEIREGYRKLGCEGAK